MDEGSIVISGEDEAVRNGKELILQLKSMRESGRKIDTQTIRYAMEIVLKGEVELLSSMKKEIIVVSNDGKPIQPKTLGQMRYINAIKKHDIVFGIAPAGTGKTFFINCHGD